MLAYIMTPSTRTAARLLLLALLLPAPAGATVILDSTLENDVQKAALIVRATVVSQQVIADVDNRTVDTLTEVRVRESLKGRADGALLIRQPGGRVGDTEVRVAGAPRFHEGEDVLLFLEPARDDPSVYLVLRMAAGKYRMEKALTGELRATRQMDGLAAYEPPPTPGSRPKLKTLSRDDHGEAEAFLQRIRLLLKKGDR